MLWAEIGRAEPRKTQKQFVKHPGPVCYISGLSITSLKVVFVDCQLSFLLGTSSHHGMSVGMFREHFGRHWAGVIPG